MGGFRSRLFPQLLVGLLRPSGKLPRIQMITIYAIQDIDIRETDYPARMHELVQLQNSMKH